MIKRFLTAAALAVCFCVPGVCAEPAKKKGEALVIDGSKLTSKPLFVDYNSNGIKMHINH